MNNRLTKLIDSKQFKKAAALSLASIIGLSSTFGLSAKSAPETAKKENRHHSNYRGCPDLSRQDLLVVMPNANADSDDLKDALENVHGTVVGSIGKGNLKVLVVKAEKGKAEETEAKLSKDTKNFRAVNANHRIKADWVPTDPTASQAWHLRKMNCMKAWDLTLGKLGQNGQRARIAVLDSGCSWQGDTGVGSGGADVTGVHRDIAEKLEDEMDGFLGTGLFGDDVEDLDKEMEYWANRAQTLSMGVQDNHGHGTWVAAAAAGRENGKCSVGVAPSADIYPIKIADGAMGTQIYTDDISLISGMVVALNCGARIVNISYSGMNDVDRHEVLHELFKHFYFNKNGMIFVSAGNDSVNMGFKDCNYINTVSALRQTKAEAGAPPPPLALVQKSVAGAGWGSNTGRCVDFAAPGIDIPVTNPNGTPATVGGTSFSSPIVAAIAALVVSVNPKLSNSQVQNILINSCSGVGGGRSTQFGFGMPDAEKAVRLALRS